MRNRELVVNPTLACGNPLNFSRDLDILDENGIKILHLDIMDGHYVPNLCFDMNIVRRIKEKYAFLLDVHLMVTNPETYIEPLKTAGVDYISFHLDAVRFHFRLLKKIRELGMKGGIALNPSQPPELLTELLPYLDFVLIMGVEPGFSGQKFIPGAMEKVRTLEQLRREHGYSYGIEVDGGVSEENTELLLRSGADVLVSGAFGVFSGREGLKPDCLKYQELVDRVMLNLNIT